MCETAAIKIIIADDEERIRRLVADFLSVSGYTPIEAADGREALEVFAQNPDAKLMILDIMMPELDGWAACRELRRQSDIPVILLTARAEEFDQLTGFEAGADEYVTKPFSPAVLVKRVEALLRRAEGTGKPAQATGLRVDAEAYAAFLDGQPLDLTLKEFEILSKLYDKPGRVYTRDQLLDAIWGYDFEGDSRTVDSHVARLRTKLGEYGNTHLKTVYGLGYKLEV